jgi:hypothetical protein
VHSPLWVAAEADRAARQIEFKFPRFATEVPDATM